MFLPLVRYVESWYKQMQRYGNSMKLDEWDQVSLKLYPLQVEILADLLDKVVRGVPVDPKNSLHEICGIIDNLEQLKNEE